MQGKDLGDRLLISQNMLRRQEMDFLDGTTLSQAETALGVPVIPVESDGFALWDAVCALAPDDTAPLQPPSDSEYYTYNQNAR